jgi:hypothetical protein
MIYTCIEYLMLVLVSVWEYCIAGLRVYFANLFQVISVIVEWTRFQQWVLYSFNDVFDQVEEKMEFTRSSSHDDCIGVSQILSLRSIPLYLCFSS